MSAEEVAALSRRLRPDFENKPDWVRAEVERLARRFAGLPPEARAKAVAANLSERVRKYYRDEAIKADIAAVELLDGFDAGLAEGERAGPT